MRRSVQESTQVEEKKDSPLGDWKEKLAEIERKRAEATAENQRKTLERLEKPEERPLDELYDHPPQPIPFGKPEKQCIRRTKYPKHNSS